MKIRRLSVLFSFIAIIIVFSSVAHAGTSPYGPENRRFGAGIIAGEPSGLTLKGYLTERLAIDAIASWSFVDKGFTLIGDATYDIFDIPTSSSTVTLPFYAGAGAKVAIRGKRHGQTKTIVGIRVPIGIAVQWVSYPVEVFLEAGPGIEVAPETRFDISGGLGIRYYFF